MRHYIKWFYLLIAILVYSNPPNHISVCVWQPDFATTDGKCPSCVLSMNRVGTIYRSTLWHVPSIIVIWVKLGLSHCHIILLLWLIPTIHLSVPPHIFCRILGSIHILYNYWLRQRRRELVSLSSFVHPNNIHIRILP